MGCGYSINSVTDDARGTISPRTEWSPSASVPTSTKPREEDSTKQHEEVPPTITVTIPVLTGTNSSESVTAIVVHFNPSNYARRTVVTNECIQRLVQTQLRLSDLPGTSTKVELDITVVELCYGSNESQTDPNNFPTVKTICCRCDEKHKMWSKENLINIALDEQYLSPETKYVAWIDSDIAFTDDKWVSDVVASLAPHEFAFGQVWSTCEMLGPEENSYEPKVMVSSFCSQYVAGKVYGERHSIDREYWHPGFAWMATVSALRATKGLIAQTLGSADRHMAMSFLGLVVQTVPDGMTNSYLDQVLTWQEYVKDNNIQLVHVPCHIHHHWHGPMHRRRYMERFEILKKHQFDPSFHLQYHYTGLYLWTDACPPVFIKDVADYFDQRDEDSKDVSEDVTAYKSSSDDNNFATIFTMIEANATPTNCEPPPSDPVHIPFDFAAAIFTMTEANATPTNYEPPPSDPLHMYA